MISNLRNQFVHNAIRCRNSIHDVIDFKESDFHIKSPQIQGRVRNVRGEFVQVTIDKAGNRLNRTRGNHEMKEHGDIIIGQSLNSAGTRLTVQIAKKVEGDAVAQADHVPEITEVVFSVVPDPAWENSLKFEQLSFRKLSASESKDFAADLKFKHVASPTSSVHGLNISTNSGKGSGGPNPQSPTGTK